jgi:hypothetical protein
MKLRLTAAIVAALGATALVLTAGSARAAQTPDAGAAPSAATPSFDNCVWEDRYRVTADYAGLYDITLGGVWQGVGWAKDELIIGDYGDHTGEVWTGLYTQNGHRYGVRTSAVKVIGIGCYP